MKNVKNASNSLGINIADLVGLTVSSKAFEKKSIKKIKRSTDSLRYKDFTFSWLKFGKITYETNY